MGPVSDPTPRFSFGIDDDLKTLRCDCGAVGDIVILTNSLQSQAFCLACERSIVIDAPGHASGGGHADPANGHAVTVSDERPRVESVG